MLLNDGKAMDNELARPLDPITGLPWSAALRPEATGWAVTSEVHALCLQVSGLSVLIDVFGYRAAHSARWAGARRGAGGEPGGSRAGRGRPDHQRGDRPGAPRESAEGRDPECRRTSGCGWSQGRAQDGRPDP